MIKDWFKKLLSEDEGVSVRRLIGVVAFVIFVANNQIASFWLMVKNQVIFENGQEGLLWIIGVALFSVMLPRVVRGITDKKKEVEDKPEEEEEKKDTDEVIDDTVEDLKKEESIDKEFIKKHEGLRLKAYQCSAKKWTIGFGSTTHASDGRPVKKGDEITMDQAEEYLDTEVKRRLAEMEMPEHLNKNQRTALLSLQYNIGQDRWKKSSIRKKVLANHEDQTIRNEFMKWVYVSGRKNRGLTKRRTEEADLYFG